MKFLLWALVGIIVVIWLTRSKNHPGRRGRGAAGGGTEPMRQCAYCGIHLPVSEAVVTASGAAYCSDEHRRLHAGS